jgi:hypothetical protein
MYSVLAAELTIWSMACIAKLKVMNSHTGRAPAKALPTAMPVKPACAAAAVRQQQQQARQQQQRRQRQDEHTHIRNRQTLHRNSYSLHMPHTPHHLTFICCSARLPACLRK